MEGLLIAVPTMAAFFIGMADGGVALGMTMAFVTLSLARLFHGFNCRADQSIFKLGFLTNRYTLLAFGIGVLLLAAVLFVPFLQPLFLVEDVTMVQVGMIVALAFAPTLIIQLYRGAKALLNR
ncbi:MAG: cation-translocating P-type ATPase C-terminal domain-containing protein [Raoultibacter sp.]